MSEKCLLIGFLVDMGESFQSLIDLVEFLEQLENPPKVEERKKKVGWSEWENPPYRNSRIVR